MRCGKGGQSGMRGWRGGRWKVGCWRRGGWAGAVGVVHGLRGDCESTAPGKEDGAARRAQFDERRANEWRACGVDRGRSDRRIFKALSRDRVCSLTRPVWPWDSRSLEYIDQFRPLMR